MSPATEGISCSRKTDIPSKPDSFQAFSATGGALPKTCLASGGLTLRPNGEARLIGKTKLKPPREKLFGAGRPRALDRNVKARIMVKARGLMRPTQKGKHYGAITAKAYAVLEALLWGFHNAKTGLCFPSYETIAERAGCHRDTVAEAIKALEAVGLLTWVNRIKRVLKSATDLFGQTGYKVQVVRTSNGYQFHDPKPISGLNATCISCKSEITSGTIIQDSFLLPQLSTNRLQALDPDLAASMERLKRAIGLSK